MSESRESVKTIFGKALEMRPDDERSKYLDQACARDESLRAEVEDLLAAIDRAGNFLGGAAPPAGPARPASDAVGTMVGHFRLLEEIGEGGMGVVYRAEQQEPVRRQVALKIIKPGMDTRQVIARFEAERQTLALMDHPNIAKVHDAGTAESGRPFFVMELVDGRRLTDYCDEKQLSTRQRLELFVQVCLAVQHAHQKGIIHRDIKPSNVLVAVYDGVAVPKVIDFGIAKALDPQPADLVKTTGLGLMMGTPAYMSPEQAGAGGQDVNTRSDIYSLGVMLYELLTGSTPFDQERVRKAAYDEIRRMIREEEPPRPSSRISTLGAAVIATVSTCRQTEPARLSRLVRGELDWIVMDAIEKDRGRRYQTANDLAQDIQRYLAGEPVLACSPSAGYRLKKFVQRNKTPVLAAALVLIALVGGTVGTTWGLLREAERAEGEQKAKKEALAAEEAEKEAKITANAVISFVEDKILAAARPKDLDGGQGYDVKLADAVKAALPFVEKSFTAQPRVEARLRMTMGISFLDLGDATTAAKQFEAARSLYTRLLGPDHPDTLKSMNNLALSYAEVGRVRDALKLREETLRLMKAKLGPNHPNTLMSIVNLANSYADVGRGRAAIELLEQTLPIMRTKLGPDDYGTLKCMSSLATFYAHAGRPKEALKLREETLRLTKAKFGPDHPDTLMCMHNLANSYADAGRFQDAIKLREETLRLLKAKFGPDHLNTLGCMYNLANSYSCANRSEDALKLREETLPLMKDKLGPDSPLTLQSMNNLANSYADAGRNQEALQLYEEAFRLMKGTFAPNDRNLLICTGNLAESLVKLHRGREAPPIIRAAGLWESLHRTDAHSLYQAACYRALAAAAIRQEKSPSADATRLANEQAEQAMAWLRQSVAAGYAGAAHMAKDEDLDALRGREDFKKLLAEVTAKEKKSEGGGQRSEVRGRRSEVGGRMSEVK